MKRIGLFALLLSACTATTYPMSSGQPQYASTQTTQTTQNPDGSTVTTTTTETASSQPYAAQPATYNEPPPPPPESEPALPPPPPPSDAACHKKDTPEMCVSLHVILDIGAIVKNSEGGSCRDASKALNRYADSHKRELETFLSLESTASKKELEKFQKRHQGEATVVITGAMELDQRCDGDEKLDRAFKRVGFTGFIGT